MQQHTHFKKPYSLPGLQKGLSVMYTTGNTDTFWANFLGKEGCVTVRFAVRRRGL